MLHKMQELVGYTVHATDGDVGKVHELILDDKNWNLRYLVIATNQFMEKQTMMVSMDWVERTDTEQRTFHLNGSREELKSGMHQDENRTLLNYDTSDENLLTDLDEALRETFPASDPAATY